MPARLMRAEQLLLGQDRNPERSGALLRCIKRAFSRFARFESCTPFRANVALQQPLRNTRACMVLGAARARHFLFRALIGE